MGNYRASSFQLARSARLILALHTSRLLRCVRATTARRTHTWQTPPCMRHPATRDAHIANNATCASFSSSIRDGSVLCEAIDSRTHSGFVPERPPLGGAYIAFFAMCASHDSP